jgi:uncharacterized protein YdeI (YjbR/CyaY-like superfamily)
VLFDLPVQLFSNQAKWRAWLEANHTQGQGVWLKIAKKDSGEKSVSYGEAVEEALCFGWIDGMVRKYDERFYIQKFTPRRKGSVWSKINVDKVQRLIENGKIHAAGLAAIEQAKTNGRWAAAYDSPTNSVPSTEFQAALDKHPKAKQFYGTLTKANKYAMNWQIQTAKKLETKQMRIEKFIAMLERGEKLH